MKILLGVPEYPPYNVGGGGIVFKNLAEQYRQKGHEVVVVYGFYPTKSIFASVLEFKDENGIHFYQIPEIPYPKKLPFLRTVMPPNLSGFIAMWKILGLEKPDVAHLHGYGLFIVNLMSVMLKLKKIKYVLTIHGYPETQKKSAPLVKLIWGIFDKTLNYFLIKNASKITAVSKFILNDSRNKFKQKSIVIYNGFDYYSYNKVNKKYDIRNKHKLKKDDFIILSIGRITEMKGFQLVVKKIPDLIKNGFKPIYMIMGEDDGYKAELQRIISKEKLVDNVLFLGYMNIDDKKQYLEQCDIFAATSIWEPFGLIALEAIFFNKIIWTTNIGGLKEILKEYKKKILFTTKTNEFMNKINLSKKIKDDFNLDQYWWDNITLTYLETLNEIKEDFNNNK